MTTAARLQVGDVVPNYVGMPITITGIGDGYYESAYGGAWVEEVAEDGQVCLLPYDGPLVATNGNGDGAGVFTMPKLLTRDDLPPELAHVQTLTEGDGRQPSPSGAAGGDPPQGTDAAAVAPLPVTLSERLPLVDLVFLGDCYNREELGDGELFAHLYHGRIVYDHTEKASYFWDGYHFRRDGTEQVKLLYGGQVAAQYLEGAAVLTRLASEATAAGNKAQSDAFSDLAQGFTRRARQLQKKHRATNALDYAAAVLGVTGDVWDICPALLPVANGVVDLATGELRPGRPGDYIRTYAPHEWRGLDEPCPRWSRFVVEIMGGDKDMAAFLQRLFGYGISGLGTEHRLAIPWGETGRNGKDTLFESLGYALGPLAGAVTKDVVIDPGGRRYAGAATPHLMELRGKRLVWASEPHEGARLDAAQVKLITGGGRLKGRPLYGSEVEWQPTHLAMLITNSRPHAPADDLALWERLLLIPFTQRFVDNPQGENEHPADKELRAKLRIEASGILAWLVRGYMEWRAKGLNPPAEVTQATAEYRQSEDTLSQFLSEQYTPQDGATVTGSQLHKTYVAWCKTWGIEPMSGKLFGEKMKNRLPNKRKGAAVVYIGIKRNAP
jgi:putative DNA primase/helicase